MKKFSVGFVMGLIIGLLLATTTFALADYPVRMTVNGREIYSDVPPQIINGRTMIPAQALAEAMGAKVDWDAATSTVIVTKPEGTKIIELRPLNTSGQIEIIGTQDFKNEIEQALLLIKEKAPDDYKLVSNFVTRIEVVNSGPMSSLNTEIPGAINFNCLKFKDYSKQIRESTKIIHMAGIIVHETYHIYTKGLIGLPKGLGFSNQAGLSTMEMEILAFARERLFYKKIGAPKALFDVTSIDYLIDTNYSGIFKWF